MVAKIYTDLEKINLNKLLEKFRQYGIDFCIAGEIIYIHYSNYRNNNPLSISYIMKELNIKNFYCKEIVKEPCLRDGNFIHQWCYEKLEKDTEEKINFEQQESLQNMMNSINKCRELLKYNIEKEGGADGREAQTRETP